MDVIEIQSDGSEKLLASGLTPGQVGEVLEWWCYTKPLGPSTRILVRENTLTPVGMTTNGDTVESGLDPVRPPAGRARSEVFAP